MASEKALGEGLWLYALRTPTLPPATTTNTLLVVGEEGAAVIEPGCPDPRENEILYARIDALQRAGKALKWILPTHQHHDHIGGVEALRERYGAEVLAHSETRDRLPFAVDRLVDDGDRLDLGGELIELHFTPGHAPGHLMAWMPRQRVAHGGDLVASEGTILVDLRDGGDMGVYIETLRRVARSFRSDWSGASLVPAHGEPIADPAALCEHYVNHRLGREAKLLAALGDERLDLDTLVARTYADKDPSIWPLARFALDAHLAKLVDEGRVRLEGEHAQVIPQ
jgi:glyoxylase-like metal-dependent hydrolase (beta-lactamase superfamily II)